MDTTLAALAAFAAPFVLSLLACAGIRRLAPALGLVDEPGGRKCQASAVPLGGGLAVALALLGALALAWAFPGSAFREGLGLRLPSLGWLLLAAGGILALGLWDDLKDLSPLPKLAGQVAAALGVACLVPEARLTAFLPDPAFQVALTVVWIVALTNAFNFIDNMDGLSAGVGAIASGLLAAVAFLTGRDLMAGFFLALLGAQAGFLVFNLPPASLYLGDAGSLLTGFLLAAGSALLTYDEAPRSLAPVGVPLLVFGVPLFDGLTVLLIRWREGRPLARGDRSHFSHRLVALGMGPRQAVGTIWLLTFVTGMGALVLYHVPPEAVPLLLLQSAGVFLALALLERAARSRRP